MVTRASARMRQSTSDFSIRAKPRERVGNHFSVPAAVIVPAVRVVDGDSTPR